MTRRTAAPDALGALCSLLLTVLLLCQSAVSAAGGVELGAGGTSREADSSPESPDDLESPGAPESTGDPESTGARDPAGEPNSPDEPGLRVSPVDLPWDDPDALDEPPPSRNGGRPNRLPTAHAPPTGNRPSPATTGEDGSAASWVLRRPPTGAPPGPPGQPPAARLPVLQVFRL